MKIKQKQIVSLQQLVPQPNSLKLLILHTPFTLQIDTLPLYINLIKLDLSRNNLQQFPYLGQLFNLKFIIIHQNKLDFPDLKKIFQKDNQKSFLCKNIVWVTFWGNKNAFLARHYLANQTSAIAVDTHMIVPQQRKEAIDSFSLEPFSFKTDISLILRHKKFDSAMPQQEYMKHFWEQMIFLRKKQEQICPIIKIQKLYRGWIFRKMKNQGQRVMKQLRQLKKKSFLSWVKYLQRCKKIKSFLKQKEKDHLLLPMKELKKRQIQLKMIQLARKAKMRVFTHKTFLKYEYKFYRAISGNWLIMKSLYEKLYLNQSKRIYINKYNWTQFQKNIIPFGKKFNPQDNIIVSKKHNINLNYLFDYQSGKREFIKLLNVHFKSKATFQDFNLKKLQTQEEKKAYLIKANNLRKKYSIFQKISPSCFKPLYPKVHFSKSQQKRMQKITKVLNNFNKFNQEELISVQAQLRTLKDLVRGVYFYNQGWLTKQLPQKRIVFLTQGYIQRNTKIVKIQKVWRGYITRKSQKALRLKQHCKRFRAAVKIQRWVRRIPQINRRKFMFYYSWFLQNIHQKYFYIKPNDYFQMILNSSQKYSKKQLIKANKKGIIRKKSIQQKIKRKPFSFPEQNIRPYIDNQTKQLLLFWDSRIYDQVIRLNYKNGKCIFYSTFLEKIMKKTGRINIISQNMNQNSNNNNRQQPPPSNTTNIQNHKKFKLKLLSNQKLQASSVQILQSKQLKQLKQKNNQLSFSRKHSSITSQQQKNISLFPQIQQNNNFTGVQLSHLFHYKTKCSLINYKGNQYIQIQCQSKLQCRKRVLGIFLLTQNFRFRYQKKSNILTDQNINIKQVLFKNYFKNNFQVFVRTQEKELSSFQNGDIDSIENQKQKQYQMDVKFYVHQEDHNKPIKISEKLKINVRQSLILKTQRNQQYKQKQRQKQKQKQKQAKMLDSKSQKLQTLKQKFKKRSQFNLLLQNYLLTQVTQNFDTQQNQYTNSNIIPNSSIQHQNQQRNIQEKSLISNHNHNSNPYHQSHLINQKKNIKHYLIKKKRSLKSIKLLKQIKPNFMLESVNSNNQNQQTISNNSNYINFINSSDNQTGQRDKSRNNINSESQQKRQRLNKEKERFATQPDLPNVQPLQFKVQIKVQNQYSSNRDLKNKEQLRRKMFKLQQQFMNKKKQKEQKKDTSNFTKNFVNIANFIENQYVLGHRRKIKSQILNQNYVSVEKVKSLQKRSREKMLRFQKQKQQQAKKKHKQHKDQVLKSSIENQQSQQAIIKKQAQMHKKSMAGNPNSNPKKIKVSFAQQCYPIMNKKMNDSFQK